MVLNFSGQTKAGMIQEEVEAKLCRKRGKGRYGPDGGLQRVVAFIDDLNMPEKEEYLA